MPPRITKQEWRLIREALSEIELAAQDNAQLALDHQDEAGKNEWEAKSHALALVMNKVERRLKEPVEAAG
jgi:hypothetical protein